MNIYEARWNNALRIAIKINSYIDQGYLVFNDENEIITGKFRITDKEIVLIPDQTKQNCVYGYFLKDRDWDEGMYTTIKEYNEPFSKWTFVHPKNIKRLFK